jgi:hypothetical protein
MNYIDMKAINQHTLIEKEKEKIQHQSRFIYLDIREHKKHHIHFTIYLRNQF